MSVNTIQTAAVIQSELDKAAVEQATSGWMEVNSNLVKYNGGSEVKIPELSMDGLADYDRQNGFVAGGVNFKYQTKTMTQDRGRSFSFDENAVDEKMCIRDSYNVGHSKWGVRGMVNVFTAAANNQDVSLEGLQKVTGPLGIYL